MYDSEGEGYATQEDKERLCGLNTIRINYEGSMRKSED